MASNVRQNRTLETYCCLRGLPEASFAAQKERTLLLLAGAPRG